MARIKGQMNGQKVDMQYRGCLAKTGTLIFVAFLFLYFCYLVVNH